MPPYVLPYREFRRLHARAYRAQQRDQSEVAGVLLLGRGGRLQLSFLLNQSRRPGSFVLDLQEISTVRRGAKSQGKRLVGMFHSHPVSHATLGPGDRRGAVLNYLQLVYDVCGLNARLWRVYRRAGRRRVKEMPLRVEKVRNLRRRSV